MHIEDSDTIRQRLRQREVEQLTALSICQKMATAHDVDALLHCMRQSLRPYLSFQDFMVHLSDEHEKEGHYLIGSLADTPKTAGSVVLDFQGIFFQQVINCAEPPCFRLTGRDIKAAHMPSSFNDFKIAGARELVVSAIPRIDKKGYFLLSLSYPKTGQFNLELSRRLQAVMAQLRITLSNIAYRQELMLQPSHQLTNLPAASKQADNTVDLIGESQSMLTIKQHIKQVAPASTSVLLFGESGTGKEVVAAAIHAHSQRAAHEMIKINCAAIPESLLESELFGHEKGSFTGAIRRKIGKFERAHKSTLFLDELGELPLSMQAKLLRVLQERTIERIGGSSPIRVDVRIITATNKDLEQAVADGLFRADLYYRINTFPIVIPPLRERLTDIPALATYFLNKVAAGKPSKKLSQKALQALQLHQWPGNVRELEHCIERAALLASDRHTITQIAPFTAARQLTADAATAFTLMPLEDMERCYLLWALAKCNGRISGPNGTAQQLGIPATTLQSKLKKLGIHKKFK